MKKRFIFIALTLSFILGGCESDDKDKLVGTWVSDISLTTGYSYEKHTYTSDHVFQKCRVDRDIKIDDCDDEQTYYLKDGKIFISDGTTMYYEIVKRGNKVYLRYYDNVDDDVFAELERID